MKNLEPAKINVKERNKELGTRLEEDRNTKLNAEDEEDRKMLSEEILKLLNEKDAKETEKDRIQKEIDAIDIGKNWAEELEYKHLDELENKLYILKRETNMISQNINKINKEDPAAYARYQNYIKNKAKRQEISSPEDPRAN